jgi:homoserine dehydrogenase
MNRIGLCGYGTVGRGVKELLEQSPLASNAKIVKVLDLPNKKEELGEILVNDYKDIVNDPSIEIVIECLGGDDLPHKVILEALKNGKHVISSNKETISKHLKEYLEAASLSHASLQFEASCGGGIPLLNPLYEVSRYDDIHSIIGILNGTTNFILTKMGLDGDTFSAALSEAQKLGFAEKDPTADLEGLDMVRKSNILASLVFGYEIDNESIPHFGIANLDKDVFAYAKKKGKVLRFVSDIRREGNDLSIIVMPELLTPKNLLAGVQYETNAVLADCEKNGPLGFVGKGAGKNPTAGAIMQDLSRILNGRAPRFSPNLVKKGIRPDLRGKFIVFDDSKKPHELLNPSLSELKSYRFAMKDEE